MGRRGHRAGARSAGRGVGRRRRGHMSKFGAGFQKDDKLLAWRPCRRVDSAELQKHFNRRLETDIYSGTSFADPRPKWWRNEANEVFRVPSPSRLGEWKLVWRPRGAAAPAPPPASAGGPPHSPAWGRTDALYDAGMDGPALRGYAPYLNLDSRGSSRAGGRERTAASRGSRRAASSMGVAGEAAGDVADAERLGTGRLNFDLVQERRGTAASRRSMGTRASSRSFAPSELSDTSTRSISSSAILARIKNLEDAIKSEKTLRVKMQSMLTLSDQGIGTRTPPGGRLPALAEA